MDIKSRIIDSQEKILSQLSYSNNTSDNNSEMNNKFEKRSINRKRMK
jgi:hypothetical protein